MCLLKQEACHSLSLCEEYLGLQLPGRQFGLGEMGIVGICEICTCLLHNTVIESGMWCALPGMLRRVDISRSDGSRIMLYILSIPYRIEKPLCTGS